MIKIIMTAVLVGVGGLYAAVKQAQAGGQLSAKDQAKQLGYGTVLILRGEKEIPDAFLQDIAFGRSSVTAADLKLIRSLTAKDLAELKAGYEKDKAEQAEREKEFNDPEIIAMHAKWDAELAQMNAARAEQEAMIKSIEEEAQTPASKAAANAFIKTLESPDMEALAKDFAVQTVAQFKAKIDPVALARFQQAVEHAVAAAAVLHKKFGGDINNINKVYYAENPSPQELEALNEFETHTYKAMELIGPYVKAVENEVLGSREDYRARELKTQEITNQLLAYVAELLPAIAQAFGAQPSAQSVQQTK